MNLQKFNLGATISGEIRGVDGKIKKTLPEIPANSFVLAFIDILYKHFSQAELSTKETDGTEASLAAFANDLACGAAEGETVWGIVIGTGTDVVAIDDYKIQTQVTANIGYGGVTVAEPVTVGTTRQFDISRTFTNNTGAALSIKEVGLYGEGASNAQVYCLDRSLINIEIANGESVSLRYRIKVTV